MADLVELAEQAAARDSDPDTSHQAAEAITRSGLREKQIAVLGYAQTIGQAGFTDFEMQAHFDDTGSTYRTRRSELCEALLIKDSGDRRKRDGRGRNFIVWRITEKGRRYLEGSL